MPTRESSSAATCSSRYPISMPPFPGPRAARARATASWRCGRSGRCPRIRDDCRGVMAAEGTDAEVRSTADAVARRSYGKLVAYLAARTRDVAGAEDALSEAFASALADWPVNGCPSNPEGWLLTVARRKMIDAGRRRRSHDE